MLIIFKLSGWKPPHLFFLAKNSSIFMINYIHADKFISYFLIVHTFNLDFNFDILNYYLTGIVLLTY